MIPYDLPMITSVLRLLPAERLASVTTRTFQTQPAVAITPARVIAELIAHEKLRRKRLG